MDKPCSSNKTNLQLGEVRRASRSPFEIRCGFLCDPGYIDEGRIATNQRSAPGSRISFILCSRMAGKHGNLDPQVYLSTVAICKLVDTLCVHSQPCLCSRDDNDYLAACDDCDSLLDLHKQHGEVLLNPDTCCYTFRRIHAAVTNYARCSQ
jgi:hypothetical protein